MVTKAKGLLHIVEVERESVLRFPCFYALINAQITTSPPSPLNWSRTFSHALLVLLLDVLA